MAKIRVRRTDRADKMLILLWVVTLIVATLAIPVIMVKRMQQEQPVPKPMPVYDDQLETKRDETEIVIPVYLSRRQTVVDVPLEQYVRGVVAAEMPPDFELEALKAQAIAARTYIVRKIVEQDFGEMPHPRAWVTDTEADQAYMTDEELRARWPGREYAANIGKINRAVAETKGRIIVYDGRPIDATYFSTSNGYTENSEDYWSEAIPYLRSVESPWDADISPKYKTVTILPVKEVVNRLGLRDMPASAGKGGKLGLTVSEMTGGNRIKTIKINGVTFSGREVREKLGLPSSHFTWIVNGDSIEFTTYGYGHGVGMSQYGANGMALLGHSAEEILRHYYQGVHIVHMDEAEAWRQRASLLTGRP